MFRVYQDKTVDNDGYSNCFHACVASILELPLRQLNEVGFDPDTCWLIQWRTWLADHGYRLNYHGIENPPPGFSIATVHTEHRYPDYHPRKAGQLVAHSCVAFNGVIVHDPSFVVSNNQEIRYYITLVPSMSAGRSLLWTQIPNEGIDIQ